jgi:hypothetical protein
MAEYEQGLFEDCIGLCREATALAVAAGDELIANGSQYQIACALRHLGRPEDANREFQAIGQMLLAERDPLGDAELAEDYAAVLIELGRWEEAGLLMGAAEAARERLNVPREAAQQQDLDGALEAARLELGPRWDSLLDEGRALPVEELLRRAFSTPPD